MNTAAICKPDVSSAIKRPLGGRSVFETTGPRSLSIRAGTEFTFADGFDGFEKPFPVALPELTAGRDYYVTISAADARVAIATLATGLPGADVIGGFHFAPGGNATARTGGGSEPAINPFSIWDAGFRPACPDPRGMALVEQDGMRFWCDIYLLGTDHLAKGTSRHGETIADGRSLPAAPDGNSKTKKLDYATAVAIYAHHGKQLLTYDEFRIAAHGVTEKSSTDDDPDTAGLDAARTSRFGIMQATGNLWAWGTDGDPDYSQPSIFGGSWLVGVAGSRCAGLDDWPDGSSDGVSARGRSDHMTLA